MKPVVRYCIYSMQSHFDTCKLFQQKLIIIISSETAWQFRSLKYKSWHESSSVYKPTTKKYLHRNEWINLKTAGKYSVHKCLWNKETLALLITFSVHICAFQGNVVLTDFEYTILSLLRTRTDTEDVRFAVREKYPIHSARQREPMMNQERYSAIWLAAKF